MSIEISSLENNNKLYANNDLGKMRRVFGELDILSTGALRASRSYDPNAPVFNYENHEIFLNNLPGIIATFKAVELQLLSERAFSPEVAQIRIRSILREMVLMPKFSDEDIKGNPRIFAELIDGDPDIAGRIILANTTWAMRALTRIEPDGSRLKRVGRVNSIVEFVCPDLLAGESPEDRFDRLREVRKDIDQLRSAAGWWLDVLEDPDRLLSELAEISQISQS